MSGLKADGVAFVFAFLLAFFFAIYTHSEEMTADKWFRLVVELQDHSSQLDREERDFDKNMINVLTLDEQHMLKPHQQTWLLHIRDRVLQKTSQ
jgi:Na+-transporting methylmalonyl-CoA/oxaloacetate decarboxylase gamma subunit